MPHSLALSLMQIVALTQESLVVLDTRTQTIEFASPRALDMLDAPEATDGTKTKPIADLFDLEDGHLLRFMKTAISVSSPIVARVRRCSDGKQLVAKAHRAPALGEHSSVIVALSGATELSKRFRLLVEKINALDLEIEQRKAAELRLSQNAVARERTLVAVRQMSEIDSSNESHLSRGLEVLRIACESSGAAVIGFDAGKLFVRAATGTLANAFDMSRPIILPFGITQFYELPTVARNETLTEALGKIACSALDLSDLGSWPLYIANVPKACLILQGTTGSGVETDIISEALASLMSRANAEADLRHAQKLQAIGELTGGIAHDFNNILSVVLGNTELILDEVTQLGQDAIEVELALSIRDAALRGATLTSRLLSFARKQPLRPQSQSLSVVLRDLDMLLRRAMGETISIEIVGTGGLWRTRIDQSQFENAVLNLALNARDAMPEGGRLTIETANTRLDAEYAAQHAEVTPGQYVMVAVTDTGIGMPSEVVREAFTPFFTTKGVGQGSGLGLSMVFGFVKQSGGHVKIYSEIQHGTTVKMYFPRDVSELSAPSDEQISTPDREHVATGRVLLVEDDPAIVRYAERTLRYLGYTVDTAFTGDDAAILVRSQSYDILLTDVVLPGKLNGARLARLATELHPQIKVLFMSGYTENSIVHNGQLDAGVELISKPFTRDQLARRLRNLSKG